MPQVLLRETNPYGTRRASVLRGDGDTYLYVEDLTGEADETVTAVWVANHAPAPVDAHQPEPPGTPPRMATSGTIHPEGCPPFAELSMVWFEEGDAVALVDEHGVVAVTPGWAGSDGFYGYSRNARGRCHLAWELTPDVATLIDTKVADSREFWEWRRGPAWSDIRASGLAHLEAAVGRQEAAWPVGDFRFPEIIASRHRFGDRDIWVTATTGLSAQRMPGVEQYHDDPARFSRIELAVARRHPDDVGAELLRALGAVPFGRVTWLGEGHTVGGAAGSYPAFGADRASLILTATPPPDGDLAAPDLSGLERRGEPVTYLWAILVNEETLGVARARDARTALAHNADIGGTWIQ